MRVCAFVTFAGAFLLTWWGAANGGDVPHLIDMDGKVHRDYVIVGGLQYLLTTVSESGFYGTATSVSTGGGIVLVKNRKVLVLAVYAEPTTAAEAIPYVHQFADNLEAMAS